ncbi:MAG: hypothetical protein WHS88_11725 [Anaerohalosphaeraceae bacterium]
MRKAYKTAILLFLLANGCFQTSSLYWDKAKTIKCWDGKSVQEFEGKPMAAMLWLRPKATQETGNFPANHQIYKRFDDTDFQIFLDCLKNPDAPRPFYTKGFTGLTSILYLSFLDGSRYIIFFTLERDTVVLPNGFSRRLFILFTQKETASTYDIQKDCGLTVFPGIQIPDPEYQHRDDWIAPKR